MKNNVKIIEIEDIEGIPHQEIDRIGYDSYLELSANKGAIFQKFLSRDENCPKKVFVKKDFLNTIPLEKWMVRPYDKVIFWFYIVLDERFEKELEELDYHFDLGNNPDRKQYW